MFKFNAGDFVERKEEILEAASRVFEKYGLAKSTLEDIAKECGIKKTALYYYFKNKEELFKTMLVKDIENIKEHVITEVDKEPDIISKIRTYLILRLNSMEKMTKYFDIFRGDSASISYRDFAYQEEEKAIHFELEFLSRLINEGVSIGELDVEYPKSLILLVLGATYGLGHEFVCEGNEIDTEKEVDNILKILLKGIQKKQENK